MTDDTPLVAVDHLEVRFPVRAGAVRDRAAGAVHAVDDVSFTLAEGETLGVVGESGCGKTTLVRALVRLLHPTAGRIRFRGKDVTGLSGRRLRPLRGQVQMVFQDPQSSLNPRKRVGEVLARPLRLRGVAPADVPWHVRDLLAHVGLTEAYVDRYPHELSGGQRQRVGLARALAMDPALLVLDEPVSALDVSVRAQVVNLLDDLQDELGLTYVFVAHDLSVVRHVSDRIAVLYLGKIVELAPAEELYAGPIHPYTAGLLAAVPIPDPVESRARPRPVVLGEPPSPIDPPSGCRFHTRCPRASDVCRTVEPPLWAYADGHAAACHHPLNVSRADVGRGRRSELSPHAAGMHRPAV